jgi:hypothetical protein
VSEHKFVIVPETDVTQLMVDACIQTSIYTLRKSIKEVPLDGYQCVLKYSGAQPSVLSAYSEITYNEALALMQTSDWSKG